MGIVGNVRKKGDHMNEKTKIKIAKFLFGCIPCFGIAFILKMMYGLFWFDSFALFALFVNCWGITMIALSD